MKVFSTTLAVAVMLPALTFAVHWKNPFIKSFDGAQKECAEYLRLTDETVERYIRSGYPDEHSARKLLHCILINLHAWKFATGIQTFVIEQYFDPSPSDSCYKNRTEDCLCETVSRLPNQEHLKRAYRSFQCYYRNYGNLNKDTHFVPYNDRIRNQHYREAFAIQDVHRKPMNQWAAGDIDETPEFAESYYTYMIRAGFYNPDVGYDLDRLYVQFGNPAINGEETRCCEASVRKQYCEEPTRIAKSFKRCLEANVPSLPLIQEIAKQLIEEFPVLPSDDALPPPCYSCGSPSPCKACSGRFNANRPCYNGQCY